MATGMVICGHKRSLFEDAESPISISKKLRYYCSSPVLPPAAVDLAPPLNDTTADGDASSTTNPATPDNSWIVESLVKEMSLATNFDDARSRASRLLEVFQGSITDKVSEDFGRENAALKDKIERMNTILKRAAEIHDDRQKELADTKREVQDTKEKLKIMERNNYALSMYLKQSQQNSSIPAQFHPHVY